VTGGPACTRRGALTLAAIAVCAAAAPAALAAAPRDRTPVVGFFGDRPLVDPSGALPAWQPPRGSGGGGAIARLTDMDLRMHGLLL
jgi:hypothetical protein